MSTPDLNNPNLPLEWDALGNVTVPAAALRQAAIDARLDKAATTRAAAGAAWRDSFETEQAWEPTPGSSTWTSDVVIELLQATNDVDDAAALRALANRIAYRAGNPMMASTAKTMLVHLARTAGALAAAGADIALVQIQITDAEDETIDELATVVRDLVSASARLEQFARERLA